MLKTILDFIKYLEELGFENFRDFNLLNEIQEDINDFDFESIQESLHYTYDFGEINVKINLKSKTYDIYYNFAYDDIDMERINNFIGFSQDKSLTGSADLDLNDFYQNIQEDIRKYWLLKELEKNFCKMPEEECNDYCMCPGGNIFLGYFNNSITQEDPKVKKFLESCKQSTYKYSSIKQALNDVLFDFLNGNGYIKKDNTTFVNHNHDVFIFCDNLIINELIKNGDVEEIIEIYYGRESWLFRTEKTNIIVAANKDYFNEYEKINDLFGWYFKERYFTDGKKYLYINNKLLSIKIKISSNPKMIQDLEYMYLLDSFDKISNFRTGVKLSILDFSHLKPNEFEILCYEYLHAAGFQNINMVGKTTSPDGGKDLIAEEILKSNTGIEKRIYLIQCKHSKTSLSREKILEIDSLLRENNAEKYLLICSNDLTSQAIDRLERQNEKRTNKVTYWGKVEFSTQLSKYPDLIRKYKLLGKHNIYGH